MSQRILLPRLKNNSTDLSNPEKNTFSSPLLSQHPIHFERQFASTQNTKLSRQSNPKANSLHNSSSHQMQIFKLRYNSRSPEYFKKKQRVSDMNHRFGKPQKKKTNQIIPQNMKELEKRILLNNAREKLKNRKEIKEKYNLNSNFEARKINLKIKHTVTEVDYDNFQPEKVPIYKSLKKIEGVHFVCH